MTCPVSATGVPRIARSAPRECPQVPGRRCLRQPPLPTTDLASTGWTPPHPRPIHGSSHRPIPRPPYRARRRRDRDRRARARRPARRPRVAGAGPLPPRRQRPPRGRAAAGRPDRRRGPGGGARPPRPDARLRHRVGPPGDRGREHPGERRHGPRPARRGSSRRDGASRRAADRAQALPRAVRGLRPGRRAGHPVPRGRGAPRPPELLLRPGGRAPRRRRARRLHLERPPGAHDHRLRRRQRDEHGPDAGRAGRDLPRAGRAVRLPRFARRSGTASRT